MVHRAGFIAYSGLYRTPTDDVRYAVWAGPVDSSTLLVGQGEQVPGLPPSVRFGVPGQLRLASDGTGAMIASLEGGRDTEAVLEWTGGEVRLLAETGTPIDPSRSGQVTEEFLSVSRSVAGTLFAVRNADFSFSVWSSAGGELVPILGDASSGAAPLSLPNGCAVEGVGRTGRTGTPILLDSGAVMFPATLADPAGRFDCRGTEAVVRYEDGALSAVVIEGDLVPGAPDWTFGDLSFQQALPNGDAVVYALLDTSGDQRWSLWLFPAEGAPRLIALQGEGIELDSGATSLGAGANYQIDAFSSENVSLRIVFEGDRIGEAVLGGAPHPGQPHEALGLPGASSLVGLLDSGSTVPSPFGESAFFDVIGPAAATSMGGAMLYANVSDADARERIGEGIWQAGLDGTITRLIGDDDTVTVGTQQLPVMPMISSGNGQEPREMSIQTLEDGGAVIYGESGVFSEPAIIYLGP